MKTILSVLYVICFTLLPAIAEPTNNQLIGHWRYSDEHRSAEFTFMKDGSFIGQLTQDEKVLWAYAGKWSLDGDTLNYEYTKSSIDRIPVGSKDHDTLTEITGEYFIIQASGTDGKMRKYVRLK